MLLGDHVLDNGLIVLSTEANRLDLCHTMPTTFANVATYTVGNKLNPTISAPVAAAPNGRKVVVSEITDGTITATSTNETDDAQFWAITDTGNSRLLAAGQLAVGQMVTSGNTFGTNSFEFGIPNQ